jgi:hypothetical protein
MISAGKKAGELADGEGEIGADHVDRGVREIGHAHHGEDQRKPARQHEQQHAVDKAVEQGNEDDFHATTVPASLASPLVDHSGRFILQMVGSVRSAVVAVM